MKKKSQEKTEEVEIRDNLVEERRLRIAELRERGLSVKEIAKVLNITVHTVSNDLRELNKALLKHFEQIKGAELVVQSVCFCDQLKEFALKELKLNSKKIQRVIKQDGTIEEIEIVDPNRPKYMMCAVKAEELKMNTLFRSGVIPSNNPEKLFDGLHDYKQQQLPENMSERTKEEILETITELAKFAPKL